MFPCQKKKWESCYLCKRTSCLLCVFSCVCVLYVCAYIFENYSLFIFLAGSTCKHRMLHKLLPNRFVLTNFPGIHIHTHTYTYTRVCRVYLNVIVIGYKFVDVQFIFFYVVLLFYQCLLQAFCVCLCVCVSSMECGPTHSGFFFSQGLVLYRQCNLRMCILLLLVLFYYVITDLFVFLFSSLLCACVCVCLLGKWYLYWFTA